MSYIRKTEDEYDIEGNYGYGDGWEAVTSESSRKDAVEQIKCYRENEPGVPFRIRKRRVKIQPPEPQQETPCLT